MIKAGQSELFRKIKEETSTYGYGLSEHGLLREILKEQRITNDLLGYAIIPILLDRQPWWRRLFGKGNQT